MIYSHNGETFEATRVSPSLPLYYNEEEDHFITVTESEEHGGDEFALEYKVYGRLEEDTSEPEEDDADEWEDEDFELLSTRRDKDFILSPSDASGLG
jgi:hypothetical protein